jgi:hypothetical protein
MESVRHSRNAFDNVEIPAENLMERKRKVSLYYATLWKG